MCVAPTPQVLAKGSQKAPWKYLDSIGVEELSFGLVPPTFQVAQAKYDPTASMLTMSVDVRFTTSSSAQAVVSSMHNSRLSLQPHRRRQLQHVDASGLQLVICNTTAFRRQQPPSLHP